MEWNNREIFLDTVWAHRGHLGKNKEVLNRVDELTGFQLWERRVNQEEVPESLNSCDVVWWSDMIIYKDLLLELSI